MNKNDGHGGRSTIPPVIYREWAPDAKLGTIVDRLWVLEGHAGDFSAPEQPVLPDGCPELIVHFGDPFVRLRGEGEERQPPMLVAGQLTGPLLLRATGRVSVLGIRFRPYGAAAVLNEPQSALLGQTIGVDAVSPSLARTLASLRNRVGTAGEAVDLAQAAIRAGARDARIDASVRRIADEIVARRGVVSTSCLARAAGLSLRQMQRRFLDLVGIPPKRLARIIRFTNALRTLERLTLAGRGTRTAADYGYADQAHFARDFRGFAGCSPTAHLMKQAELAGFFTHSPASSARR